MQIEGTLTVQHPRRVDLLAVFTTIHISSQKGNSPKSICRTVHMGLILRRSRSFLTLRAQKADHYMLRVRIKRCARAHTRHRPGYRLYGGRGSQEFMGAV
jgi:hypothetical protein